MDVLGDVDLGTDPTETGRLGEALRRLLPALERASEATPVAGYPAFRPSTDGSLHRHVPADGVGLDQVVAELQDIVAHGCAISSPGFFGFITTGPTTAPLLAQMAAATAGGQRYLHHAFNHVEHQALRWLAEVCGLPSETAGVFTSGGSTANLVGLGAARQAAYERLGIDVAEDGSVGAPPGRIYASARAHRTIHRSAAALGLGRAAVTAIPTDVAGHIDTAALAEAIDRDRARGVVPIAAVAIAGNTDTGAVDPIAAVVDVARERDCWVHVDGAYGLVARASPALAPLFDGVESADSWIVDPHKWLSTGVGVGAVYVHDAGVLTRAFAEGHADYLEGAFAEDEEAEAVSQFDGLAAPWADQSVELSAPPRGVMVWAVLREIGLAGVAQRVERHVALARHLAERVREHDRLELLCDPELSIVCFRYAPAGGDLDGDAADVLNARLLAALRRETTTAPTSTVVAGHFALRPCFINPRTTVDHVDELVANVVALGDRLASA